MSHFNDVELENQNLRQTTATDSGAFANLPGEELSEQDLDAVSGGNLSLIAATTAGIAGLIQWTKKLDRV